MNFDPNTRLKISRIKLNPDEVEVHAYFVNNEGVIERNNEIFFLRFKESRKEPYETVRIIAKWMFEKNEVDKKDSRMCPGGVLKEHLKLSEEIEFQKKVYETWCDLINKVGTRGKYQLKWKSATGSEIIEDVNFRTAFSEALFQHSGKTSKKSVYWLGDYETTEVIESPELYEKKKKETAIKHFEHQVTEVLESTNKMNELFLDIILPPIPTSKIVGREKDLENITNALHHMNGRNVDSSNRKVLAISGWPGVGKTTLASILAHDEAIKSYFEDGILWISLGQQPETIKTLKKWSMVLPSSELPGISSIEEGEIALKKFFFDKNILIIADDVWKVEDAKPFLNVGKKCVVMITTRLPKIAHALVEDATDRYKLEILSEEDSIALLGVFVPSVVNEHRDLCYQLVNDLKGLPLAINVAGSLLRKQYEYGLPITQLIEDLKHGRQILDEQVPIDMIPLVNETSPTVAALLKRSVDFLKPQIKDCFALLGDFPPKPAKFDLEELRAIWQISDPVPICKELIDYGLLEPAGEKGTFQIHYLLMLLAESILKNNE